MRKIVYLAMAAFVFVIIGGIVWLILGHFIDSWNEERNAKEFIEEKYGKEVLVISETKANFVEGQSYQMAFEEQKDAVFTVTVDLENYATIYRDDSEAVLAAHQAALHVEKLMPRIEEIGFTNQPSVDVLQHVVKSMRSGETVRWMELRSTDSYENIDQNEIQSMTELLELQHDEQIDIQKIVIESKEMEHYITLDLREMDGHQSAEQVWTYVIQANPWLLNNQLIGKWQETAMQAQTERFQFFDEWNEQWLNCTKSNEQGECISLLAVITFSPGQLSPQNPKLAQDLDAIFDFLEKMEPTPPNKKLLLTDIEREGDPISLTLEDRSNYSSTEELINALVKD